MGRTSPAAATRAALEPLARTGMAAALAVTVAGALTAALTGARPAALAAEAGILTFAALVLIRPTARDLTLLGASAVLAATVALRTEAPAAMLERGLGLAAYLATFLLTLGFVRDAARTSPLVGLCGAYMTAQPPGRRYAVLTVGAHLFSIIVSFGVLNLLGTMVLRGNTLEGAGGDERVRAIREQRMLSALMRGFGAMLVWSPTAVNQALLLTFIPGLTWLGLLPLGLGMAVLLMACGWAADRLAWPPAQRRAMPGPAAPAGGRRAALRMLLLVVLVLGLVAAADALFAPSLIVAVMLVAPAFALAWIAVQNARAGAGPALLRTARRLGRAVADGFPASRSEVSVLAAAGFIGTCVGALVPVAAVAGAIEALNLPTVAVLAAIMLLIPLASQAAVNPIVSFTLLGAAIQQGLFADVDGRLVAVAMSAGWALSLSTSPFSAAVLIVARLTALPVTRIAHRWHGPYALGAWAAAALYLAALAAWLGG